MPSASAPNLTNDPANTVKRLVDTISQTKAALPASGLSQHAADVMFGSLLLLAQQVQTDTNASLATINSQTTKLAACSATTPAATATTPNSTPAAGISNGAAVGIGAGSFLAGVLAGMFGGKMLK